MSKHAQAPLAEMALRAQGPHPTLASAPQTPHSAAPADPASRGPPGPSLPLRAETRQKQASTGFQAMKLRLRDAMRMDVVTHSVHTRSDPDADDDPGYQRPAVGRLHIGRGCLGPSVPSPQLLWRTSHYRR